MIKATKWSEIKNLVEEGYLLCVDQVFEGTIIIPGKQINSEGLIEIDVSKFDDIFPSTHNVVDAILNKHFVAVPREYAEESFDYRQIVVALAIVIDKKKMILLDNISHESPFYDKATLIQGHVEIQKASAVIRNTRNYIRDELVREIDEEIKFKNPLVRNKLMHLIPEVPILAIQGNRLDRSSQHIGLIYVLNVDESLGIELYENMVSGEEAKHYVTCLDLKTYKHESSIDERVQLVFDYVKER